MSLDHAPGNASIIIPTTFVKKPGFLKCSSDASSVQFASVSTQSSLQSLLDDFKSKSEVNMNCQGSSHKPSERNTRRIEPVISVDSAILRYYSENSIMEPGKIKRFSDEICDLIKIAQKVLLRYNVKVTVETSSQYSKKLFLTLKILIPEISFFSTDFFKNLNINEFIFSEEESGHFLPGRVYFPLKPMDSQYNVYKRFYRSIFTNLNFAKPQLLEEWREFDKEAKDHSNALQGLEEAFVNLMSSLNRKNQSKHSEKLVDLLGNYYPELTEEWFRIRNVERKKNLKVTFSL